MIDGNHRTAHDRGIADKPITVIWFRGEPYTVDTPACRKALVRRQVKGELTNMTSLAVAASMSRSTASRFFSRRGSSLAATLRILKALRLEFGDVCQPAARLGHANETLLIKTYGHVIPGQDQEAADRLAETLRSAQFTRSAHEAEGGSGA